MQGLSQIIVNHVHMAKTAHFMIIACNPLLSKGTKRQYSGQMSQIFKTVKSIEINRRTITCNGIER